MNPFFLQPRRGDRCATATVAPPGLERSIREGITLLLTFQGLAPWLLTAAPSGLKIPAFSSRPHVRKEIQPLRVSEKLWVMHSRRAWERVGSVHATRHARHATRRRDGHDLHRPSCMLDHVPPRHHPERPERLQAVLRHLERTGQLQASPKGPVREATARGTRSRPIRFHISIESAPFELKGGGPIEADTWVFPGSHEAALLAAGAAVEAVGSVLGGDEPRALCLVRPRDIIVAAYDAMGFCLYNNVAVAAAEAASAGGSTGS